MKRMSSRNFLPVAVLALLAQLLMPGLARCSENGAAPDSSGSIRWGGVYTGDITLREDSERFPYNDPSSKSYLTDRVSLMFDAYFGRYLNLFVKGTTGLLGRDEDICSSRFFIDQGHISATWRDRVTGKLFLRERVFRNRNSLMFLVSNDSPLISKRGEGLDVAVWTAGPVQLTYTGAVFRSAYEQKKNFGLPAMPVRGEYLNLFEGGIRRASWHAGLTLADMDTGLIDDSVLYGIDGGFAAAGGRINIEFARSADAWDQFEDGLFGLDLDEMKWGSFSAGLPRDGVLAAEWTGFDWNGGGKGRFGLTPGYRYSGEEFSDSFGEISSGYVESYIETWWKHANLALLLSVKAADRYDYETGEGGGVLETSFWTRFKGGLESTARAFFADGSRPVLILSTVDDNSLTRLLAIARLDDTGGKSEFSFLAQASVNLGRTWTLGGSVYLERSMEGFYSADIEMRGVKRFVFGASAGTCWPISTYADLNYDPAPTVTVKDMKISFYTRIWLGGI